MELIVSSKGIELKFKSLEDVCALADASKKSDKQADTANTDVSAGNGKASPVSIAYIDDKNPVGIRIKTLDEDFCLSIRNLGGHKKHYTWKEMMILLNEKGLTTFNYKQAHIIAAYRDEVDKLLEEVDGEPMDDCCFWSMSEYIRDNVWVYWGCTGTVNYNKKNFFYSVRPLIAL